ncbi:hypothetical protein HYV85_06445 [Candidatus Woesearchaeota archaeon]|nr:hypothetical protein [Candidatus Woesearchaeota archaeon]
MRKAGIVVVAVSTLVALTLASCNAGVQPTATPVTSNSSLESIVAEQITFEAAKGDESLRQAYLNQLFLQREQLGDDSWLSFDSFIYDPKLELLGAAYKKRGIKPTTLVQGYEETTPGFKALMATPYFGVQGVPLETHVSSTAFGIAQSQGEILSLLDNESSTAHLFHKGEIHMEVKQPSVINPDMFSLISELLSFEKQFYNIETGRRSVSESFIAKFRSPARLLYKKVEMAALGKGPDAEFARYAIEAIQNRPTLKYFK